MWFQIVHTLLFKVFDDSPFQSNQFLEGKICSTYPGYNFLTTIFISMKPDKPTIVFLNIFKKIVKTCQSLYVKENTFFKFFKHTDLTKYFL